MTSRYYSNLRVKPRAKSANDEEEAVSGEADDTTANSTPPRALPRATSGDNGSDHAYEESDSIAPSSHAGQYFRLSVFRLHS